MLISEYFHPFRIRQFLARYTHAPVGMVMDVADLVGIFEEDRYRDADGGLLAGLGRLFPKATAAYVYYPSLEDNRIATLDALPIPNHLRPLLGYLRERRLIVPLTLPAGLRG